MSLPYSPTPFTSPVVNPAIGGAGTPIPYISNSQYAFAPTAMDVSNLIDGGTPAAQTRALADVIRRASAWADRVCFGADAAAKGASLAATLSVQSAQLPVLGGELRLVCDYKPIIQVNGVDLGANMASLAPLADASVISIGRRTIYVPLSAGIVGRDNGALLMSPQGSRYTVVWSYVNGYPHTSLAAGVVAGASSITVAATDGGTGLLGVLPGMRMSIVDGQNTESFTVDTVTGSTITTKAPLAFPHALPASPDFLPVTAIPDEVEQAVILMTTALIKTRGDNSLVLDGITEPKEAQSVAGDEWSDMDIALQMLAPYRVRIKSSGR